MNHIQKFVAARVAGILIVPTASPRPETIRLLSAIPHVQLLRQSHALQGDWFGVDDEQALGEATNFVLQHGHRRVAYIGGSRTLSTGHDRLAGFRRALTTRRVPFVQSLIKLGQPTADFGLRATEALLERKQGPTAIVLGSVPATLGSLDAIHRLGVPVPADISIVGFGDPSWFEWWGPGRTTLRLPIRELAQACGSSFLHRLEGRSASSPAGSPPVTSGGGRRWWFAEVSGRSASLARARCEAASTNGAMRFAGRSRQTSTGIFRFPDGWPSPTSRRPLGPGCPANCRNPRRSRDGY